VLDPKHLLVQSLSAHKVGGKTHNTLLQTIRTELVAGIGTESHGTIQKIPYKRYISKKDTVWRNGLLVGSPLLFLASSNLTKLHKRFEATGPNYLVIQLMRDTKSSYDGVKYDIREESLKALGTDPQYLHLVQRGLADVDVGEPCIVLGDGVTTPLGRCLLYIPIPGSYKVEFSLKKAFPKSCAKRSRTGATIPAAGPVSGGFTGPAAPPREDVATEGEGTDSEENDGQYAATDEENDEEGEMVVKRGRGGSKAMSDQDVTGRAHKVDTDLQLADQFGSVMDIASTERDGHEAWVQSAGVMLRDAGTNPPPPHPPPFPLLSQPPVPWT
jgi:hypothetical protein